MDTSLLKTIRQGHLTQKQAQVYLALLELGQGTVSKIALTAELKRSNVYLILKELIQQGLVSEISGQKVKRYSPQDPLHLLQNMQQATSDLKFMLPLLRSLHQWAQATVQIEYYEGEKDIASIFQRFGNAKDVRYVSSFARLQQHVPKEVQRWVQSAVNGKTHTEIHQLIADEPEGRAFAQRVKKNPAWNIRLLPRDVVVQIDLAIFDDFIAIACFEPLCIIIIHSKPLTQTFAQLYDLHWKSAKRFRPV